MPRSLPVVKVCRVSIAFELEKGHSAITLFSIPIPLCTVWGCCRNKEQKLHLCALDLMVTARSSSCGNRYFHTWSFRIRIAFWWRPALPHILQAKAWENLWADLDRCGRVVRESCLEEWRSSHYSREWSQGLLCSQETMQGRCAESPSSEPTLENQIVDTSHLDIESMFSRQVVFQRWWVLVSSAVRQTALLEGGRHVWVALLQME